MLPYDRRRYPAHEEKPTTIGLLILKELNKLKGD